ncbi:MAG: right-handed parallel beta-helix repeat-containing protein [Gammaproteobacteria bacterium]|nr:right-handed parallel beta-helix repeat-containing protein [Gammaproteobacteria bacterium]
MNSTATGGVLGIASEVWVIPSNITAGYTIEADRVALVAAPGVVINGPDGGEFSYVISASGKDFLWLEGMEIDAAGDGAGVSWQLVRFSAMRDIIVENADTGPGQHGVSLTISSSNSLSNITANNNGGFGISLNSSSNNTFSDVTASNNGSGVYIEESSNNTFSGVIANNNDFHGVKLYSVSSVSSDNNTLSGVTANNNGEYGLVIFSSNNIISGVTASNSFMGIILNASNTVSNVTASGNYIGLHLAPSFYSILSNITASNNDTGVMLISSTNNLLLGVTVSNNNYGVYIEDSTGNTLSGVTASNNNTGIELFNSSNNYFTGDFKVGTNGSDCRVTTNASLTNPGLDDDSDPSDQGNDTVHDGLCIQEGASDFGTAVTGITLGSSFVAKDYQDDSANTSDTDGNAVITDFALSFDWVNFENPYRLWGKEGSAFPSETNRGMIGCSDKVYTNQMDCETNFEAWAAYARIWDWSLLATDTVIKDLLPLPTGNDTLTHTWSDLSTSIILRNAVEIQGDEIGDDDTLCETGETCLYTPNMGSYQGHGSLISAGSIGTGGTLENIILMKYETNGY